MRTYMVTKTQVWEIQVPELMDPEEVAEGVMEFDRPDTEFVDFDRVPDDRQAAR